MLNWVRRARAGLLQDTAGEDVPLKERALEFEAEIDRLRKELVRRRLNLEIAKNAAARFAKESRRGIPESKQIAT